jgi:hypothetical protein
MVPSVWSSSHIRRFAKRKWDLPFLPGRRRQRWTFCDRNPVLWPPGAICVFCMGAGYSFPRLKTLTSRHAVRTVDRTLLTWISVFSACVLSRPKNNSCKQVVAVRQYIQRVRICYVLRHWKWVNRLTLSVAAEPRYALATGLVSIKRRRQSQEKKQKTNSSSKSYQMSIE